METETTTRHVGEQRPLSSRTFPSEPFGESGRLQVCRKGADSGNSVSCSTGDFIFVSTDSVWTRELNQLLKTAGLLIQENTGKG